MPAHDSAPSRLRSRASAQSRGLRRRLRATQDLARGWRGERVLLAEAPGWPQARAWGGRAVRPGEMVAFLRPPSADGAGAAEVRRRCREWFRCAGRGRCRWCSRAVQARWPAGTRRSGALANHPERQRHLRLAGGGANSRPPSCLGGSGPSARHRASPALLRACTSPRCLVFGSPLVVPLGRHGRAAAAAGWPRRSARDHDDGSPCAGRGVRAEVAGAVRLSRRTAGSRSPDRRCATSMRAVHEAPATCASRFSSHRLRVRPSLRPATLLPDYPAGSLWARRVTSDQSDRHVVPNG